MHFLLATTASRTTVLYFESSQLATTDNKNRKKEGEIVVVDLLKTDFYCNHYLAI